MGYIKRGYKARFIIVLVCILVSAIANVAGSLFLGSLIDDYITPCWVRRIQTFPAWCGPGDDGLPVPGGCPVRLRL